MFNIVKNTLGFPTSKGLDHDTLKKYIDELFNRNVWLIMDHERYEHKTKIKYTGSILKVTTNPIRECYDIFKDNLPEDMDDCDQHALSEFIRCAMDLLKDLQVYHKRMNYALDDIQEGKKFMISQIVHYKFGTQPMLRDLNDEILLLKSLIPLVEGKQEDCKIKLYKLLGVKQEIYSESILKNDSIVSSSVLFTIEENEEKDSTFLREIITV